MHDSLHFLLRNAELKIIDFDIHIRKEMKTYNRIRPCYVMSYHKKGSAKLRIGNEIHQIGPGTVVLIPPQVKHDHYKDDIDESVFLWCHFTFDIAGVIDVLKILQFPLTFSLHNHEEFEMVFLQYKELSNQTNMLTTILKKAKELELLYLLLDGAISIGCQTPFYQQSQNFLSILAHIVRHPEEEISLQCFSKLLNMHPTYISNRFKELFGTSPIQVQREMKVHRAKTLLSSSELTITEVAQAVGFNGITSFSRLFKSYVGISPTQFREMNKKSVAGLFC